ncbi:MAG: ammonium transporter [Cyanobacteria bacterium RYN_339]|nr:ammonium transporter [Cyanobacteria bacterium RYN_339]
MNINGGDTVFVLLSSALVLMMTPGLAFFYAGMVRQKNVVNTIMLCFAAMGVVSLQWLVLGYSLSFGPGVVFAPGWLGSWAWAGLAHVGLEPNAAYAATIPHLAFMIFQAMFAIITPALISGAIVERIRFTSFLAFILIWATVVYDTVAHWVWAADGWLHALGALDFAGGTVVHITAGTAGLVAALMLGRRDGHGHVEHPPHNAPLVLMGAALLWVGWFGFNAGSALAANGVATLAFVTTHMAAATGLLTWIAIEYRAKGHVSVTGAVSGMVAGLVGITPAAGYVTPLASVAIGFAAAALCQVATSYKARTSLDDTLDTFALHGVGGIVGALLTGVFASKAANPGGADGLLYGNPHQLLTQGVAVGATVAFTAIATWGILKALGLVMALRVDRDVEAAGLDEHLHGAPGYLFNPTERRAGGGRPQVVSSPD